MPVIGMDLGGTKLATAVFDAAGEALYHDRVALDGRRGTEVAALVVDRCAAARAPEVVVFGGGVFGPAARFLDRIRAEALRWAQPISVRETRFVASTLGGDAGLYGAARLALLERSTATSTR